MLLGNGWFRGRLGWGDRRAVYGDRLALLAQLEVTTADGAVHVLATDETWTARESGVLADDLYDGQRTDLRPRRGDRSDRVEAIEADLSPPRRPRRPARAGDRDAPGASTCSARRPARRSSTSGRTSSAGCGCACAAPSPGPRSTIRHAEVLEDGELGVRPLRTAKATDSYLLAGGVEVLEPSLTFHGFRYAEIERRRATSRAEDVEAVVVGSDLRRTGWFSSSDERLDRFHENVVWSMRGNFLDVPTDCPQRDERLGWTGDIQVFAPAATFLFDAAGFLSSWLADLAAEQHADGSVPFVIPDVLDNAGAAAAGWGDAATLVPWVVYQRTGDLGLLARQLPSMRAWVDRVAALAGDGPPVDRRLPVRRLARPDRAAGRRRRGQGRPRRGRHRPPRPLGRGRRRSPPTLVGELDIADRYARLADRRPRRVRARVRDRRRPRAQRRRHRLRAGARSGRCCRPTSSAGTPASAWPTSCAPPASGSAPASSARR